jgi:hypothetical protein
VGSAATIRTESLVYGAVAGSGVCVFLLVRGRRLLPAALVGVALVVGVALPMGANVALERATVGTTIRSERVSGTAAQDGSIAGSRLEEGALTAVGYDAHLGWGPVLVGLVGLGLLMVAAAKLSSGDFRPAVIAAVGVAVLYLVRFSAGPGFVPGLVAASPLAAVGVTLGWRRVESRLVLGLALLALPVTWAFQFLGGAGPQWGGRYVLVSSALLTVVGVVGTCRLPAWGRTAAFALAGIVTAFGLSWLSIRSHEFGRAEAALVRRPEPVLVFRIAHLAREGGAAYADRRWLTATSDDDVRFAADVLTRAGFTSFGVVESAASVPTAAPSGFTASGADRLRLASNTYLRITTYQSNVSSSNP